MSTMFDPESRAIPFVDEGSGPAVVLIPGGSLGVDYLGTLAEILVEEHFRVLRVGSRRAEPGVTMHDLAQDVVDVMDHVGLADAWIGGHAFGNRVARAVGLDHVDRVNGILLLAAGGTVPPTGAALEATKTVFSNAPENEIIAAMPYLLGRDEDPQRGWNLVKDSLDGALGPMQRAAVEATPQEEWAPLAEGVPALIVQGTDDQSAPPANGEQLLASAADRASLSSIDGAGHLFPVTHPGETAAIIEDYLDWD